MKSFIYSQPNVFRSSYGAPISSVIKLLTENGKLLLFLFIYLQNTLYVLNGLSWPSIHSSWLLRQIHTGTDFVSHAMTDMACTYEYTKASKVILLLMQASVAYFRRKAPGPHLYFNKTCIHPCINHITCWWWTCLNISCLVKWLIKFTCCHDIR